MRRETFCGVRAEASAETFEAAYRIKVFQGLRMYESSQSIRLEGKRSWIGIVVERVNVNSSRGYVRWGGTNAGTITRIESAEVGGAFDMYRGGRENRGRSRSRSSRKEERKEVNEPNRLLARRPQAHLMSTVGWGLGWSSRGFLNEYD